MQYSKTLLNYRNFDPRYENESFFEILQLYRQPRFTDRIQTKAYTIDDLVGSVGGFVGLFMGYAIVQFPSFASSAVHFIKRRLFKSKI